MSAVDDPHEPYCDSENCRQKKKLYGKWHGITWHLLFFTAREMKAWKHSEKHKNIKTCSAYKRWKIKSYKNNIEKDIQNKGEALELKIVLG